MNDTESDALQITKEYTERRFIQIAYTQRCQQEFDMALLTYWGQTARQLLPEIAARGYDPARIYVVLSEFYHWPHDLQAYPRLSRRPQPHEIELVYRLTSRTIGPSYAEVMERLSGYTVLRDYEQELFAWLDDVCTGSVQRREAQAYVDAVRPAYVTLGRGIAHYYVRDLLYALRPLMPRLRCSVCRLRGTQWTQDALTAALATVYHRRDIRQVHAVMADMPSLSVRPLCPQCLVETLTTRYRQYKHRLRTRLWIKEMRGLLRDVRKVAKSVQKGEVVCKGGTQ